MFLLMILPIGLPLINKLLLMARRDKDRFAAGHLARHPARAGSVCQPMRGHGSRVRRATCQRARAPGAGTPALLGKDRNDNGNIVETSQDGAAPEVFKALGDPVRWSILTGP